MNSKYYFIALLIIILLIATYISCGDDDDDDSVEDDDDDDTYFDDDDTPDDDDDTPDDDDDNDDNNDTTSTVGCSDGTREGFIDSIFTDIAGCAGSWTVQSLRNDKTIPQIKCGNDLPNNTCNTPADLCADGWDICFKDGNKNNFIAYFPGNVDEQAEYCKKGGISQANTETKQSFVAASSHCETLMSASNCTYDKIDCIKGGNCSEPVCCGSGCRGDQTCTDLLWPGETYISGSTFSGCGDFNPEDVNDVIGVLCCRN